jgi:hypothetical protein
MNRTEYYQRLADKHGDQKVIALLCDIIDELRAQLGQTVAAVNETASKLMRQSQTKDTPR